jgi:hypothetical protein
VTITFSVPGYDGNAAVRSATGLAHAQGWTDVRLSTIVPSNPSDPTGGWTVTLLVYNQR